MPIYEYRCSGCEHEFEELVSLSASEERLSCPACGEPRAERRLSTFSLRVAGGSGNRSSSSTKSCGGCRRSSCAGC